MLHSTANMAPPFSAVFSMNDTKALLDARISDNLVEYTPPPFCVALLPVMLQEELPENKILVLSIYRPPPNRAELLVTVKCEAPSMVMEQLFNVNNGPPDNAVLSVNSKNAASDKMKEFCEVYTLLHHYCLPHCLHMLQLHFL